MERKKLVKRKKKAMSSQEQEKLQSLLNIRNLMLSTWIQMSKFQIEKKTMAKSFNPQFEMTEKQAEAWEVLTDNKTKHI